MTPSLRSERLVLEPYVPADEEAFVALFLDPRVSRWMGDGPWPEEQYRTTFSRIFTHAYGREGSAWPIVRPSRRTGIKPAKVVEGHELIYGLAPEAWGQGLGTELARTLVAYGFDALGLDQVYATVAEPNTASLGALRKVGFQHVRDITGEDGGTTLLLARER